MIHSHPKHYSDQIKLLAEQYSVGNNLKMGIDGMGFHNVQQRLERTGGRRTTVLAKNWSSGLRDYTNITYEATPKPQQQEENVEEVGRPKYYYTEDLVMDADVAQFADHHRRQQQLQYNNNQRPRRKPRRTTSHRPQYAG